MHHACTALPHQGALKVKTDNRARLQDVNHAMMQVAQGRCGSTMCHVPARCSVGSIVVVCVMPPHDRGGNNPRSHHSSRPYSGQSHTRLSPPKNTKHQRNYCIPTIGPQVSKRCGTDCFFMRTYAGSLVNYAAQHSCQTPPHTAAASWLPHGCRYSLMQLQTTALALSHLFEAVCHLHLSFVCLLPACHEGLNT
jgi:hypothetical protein